MATKIKAKLLESQGYFIDALEIYKKLLQKNPDDDFIQSKVEFYSKINVKVLEFFVRMTKKEDYEKFKRWLYK